MAQLDVNPHPSVGRLNILRCAYTGAAVAAVLFVLDWLAVVLHIAGMHMYAGIYGFGVLTSIGGLVIGLICSVAAGLLLGALVAVTYNAFEFAGRR